jgi:hypothetical protein
MVTVCPPARLPEFGETDETTGRKVNVASAVSPMTGGLVVVGKGMLG